MAQKNIDIALLAAYSFYLPQAYQTMGSIKREQKLNKASISYYRLSLKEYERLHDNNSTSSVMINLGNIYTDLNLLDSAWYFLEKGYDKAIIGKSHRKFQLKG